MSAITALWRRGVTSESFNVANRNVPLSFGIISIAATWTQAIVILGSGAYAFASPWHLLSFWLPGSLALVLTALVAPRFGEVIPKGYTFPEFMGAVFGPGVRTMTFLSSLGTLVVVTGFTLTALQQWLASQLSFPPLAICFGLSVLGFACVVFRGIMGSVWFLDIMKFTLLSLGMAGALALDVSFWGSAPIMPALGKVDAGAVFWFIGVPLAASLLGGGFCNSDTATRAYAVERRSVRLAYLGGALFFGTAILVFGSLGFLAQSMGLQPAPRQAPALLILLKTMPSYVLLMVSLGLVLILVAALGSLQDGANTLVSVEVYKRWVNPSADSSSMVTFGRFAMVGAVALGMFIAYFNFDLTRLLAALAVVRGQVIIPAILAAYAPRLVSGRAVFWAMVIGGLGGMVLMFAEPIFGAPAFLSSKGMPFGVGYGDPLGGLVAVFAIVPALLLALVGRKHRV